MAANTPVRYNIKIFSCHALSSWETRTKCALSAVCDYYPHSSAPSTPGPISHSPADIPEKDLPVP